MGTINLQPNQKLWVTWGHITCDWHLKWVRGVFWDKALNLWDLTFSPHSVTIELNCKTPS